jgi:hypothetical protein
LKVLADDTQKLNEYPSFMRVLMTGGTTFFLYKFGQTMKYLDKEKHQETAIERAARRTEERLYREKVRNHALTVGQIKPPSDEHIRAIIQKAAKLDDNRTDIIS